MKPKTRKGLKKSANGHSHKANGTTSSLTELTKTSQEALCQDQDRLELKQHRPTIEQRSATTPQATTASRASINLLPVTSAGEGSSTRHTAPYAPLHLHPRHSNGVEPSPVRTNPEEHGVLSIAERRFMSSTSMETEYIEALYSNLSSMDASAVPVKEVKSGMHFEQQPPGEMPPNSSSESDGLDYEDADSYDDHGDDGDCEDFDEELDVYEHDEFLSSQEAILMELRREQVEFEENVRQLQQQLQRQGSLLPQASNEAADFEDMAHCDVYSDNEGELASPVEEPYPSLMGHHLPAFNQQTAGYVCELCSEPRSTLCLEKQGWAWRPLVIEALATAAAAIANFSVRQHPGMEDEEDGDLSLQSTFRHSEFLQRPAVVSARSSKNLQHAQATDSGRGPAINSHTAGLTLGGQETLEPVPIRHMYRGTTPPPPAILYPLPPNAPYKFGRKASEFLEPVGEFHEFQSAEGNSRQVLLHVWPPSSLDTALLQKLEACCRDFQDNDIVRGHSGDGFLNGWRPSWKQPHQTGVLRFGHWRVKAPVEQGLHLYPPFQTPLTLAAGGGSVLGSTVNMNVSSSTTSASSKDHMPTHPHHHGHNPEPHSAQQPRLVCGAGERDRGLQDIHLEASTQGRLLRLIRAIQMVEKGIIARHLKYLFPTLYEKYHGLQFGTPRLFDAVATVALAMDVSPRLHHDKAHTKHGFCWIIACGDFVGGDLCIPQLGKRVVMRPGTVVAIRSTVVAYYLERYAKNTSMYVVYAYTSDNNWPPAV
ncbi:hypothetical protein BGZ67_009403 [Mortierella alpina]|nr:hypothetical protein BGZ67_009403 [Mortierella alpina]